MAQLTNITWSFFLMNFPPPKRINQKTTSISNAFFKFIQLWINIHSITEYNFACVQIIE